MAKRAYCKNTVKGSQRGRKYPPKVRAEVLMAMLSSGSICAVARRYGVPESTIRSWMAEEAGRSDAFAKERQAAAREIAIRASLGARAQVSYLQSRVDESQRAAQVQAKLHRKLDEDARARNFAIGTMLTPRRPGLCCTLPRAATTGSWTAKSENYWTLSSSGTVSA